MVDTIFSTSDAVPAISPEVEDLVSTTGLDGNGKVLLSNASGLKISDDGIITSKTGSITFNSIRDISLFETSQTVTTTSATTPIDLDIASTIVLNQNIDTTLAFTPSVGGARFFLLLRQKDDTTNARALSLGTNWIVEQKTQPVWSQTPLAEDIIWGFVDVGGSVISRQCVANYTPRVTKSGGVFWRKGAAKYLKQPRDVPNTNVTGVESGQIITGMEDKTLNACSVKVTANEFPNEIDILGCLLRAKVLPMYSTGNSGVVALNATTSNLWKINGQNGDITEIDLTLHTSGNGLDKPIVTIIHRVKDDTENPYTIFFDPLVFTYEGTPVITNTAGAEDFYVIYSVKGKNYLSWFNNFGGF